MDVKILVVDDEVEFCSFIKELLETRAGFKVQTVTDPVNCFKIVKRKKPNLILLDIMMPKMDGFEVLKSLKADPETCYIPVVMVTARSDEEFMKKASTLYDDGYLIKPFNYEALYSKIMEVLKRHYAP